MTCSEPDNRNPWAAPVAALSTAAGRGEGLARRFVAWLVSRPEEVNSPGAVIAWWEARRLPFNAVVGTYGVACLVVYALAITSSGHPGPGEDVVEPMALLAAPVVVNVLYTLGWVAENLARSLEPDLSPRFGPRLFALGLGLGLFLVTLPAAFWVGSRVLQAAGLRS